jgi:hypothetical protein
MCCHLKHILVVIAVSKSVIFFFTIVPKNVFQQEREEYLQEHAMRSLRVWLKIEGNGRETPPPVHVTTFSTFSDRKRERERERERDSRLYDNG